MLLLLEMIDVFLEGIVSVRMRTSSVNARTLDVDDQARTQCIRPTTLPPR